MKCQSLFSGNNKKNMISFSSAEYARVVVKINRGLSFFAKDNFYASLFAFQLTLGANFNAFLVE